MHVAIHMCRRAQTHSQVVSHARPAATFPLEVPCVYALLCAPQVLQSADCRPGDSHASRARLKGSFRHAAAAAPAADTLERLVDAYQVGNGNAVALPGHSDAGQRQARL